MIFAQLPQVPAEGFGPWIVYAFCAIWGAVMILKGVNELKTLKQPGNPQDQYMTRREVSELMRKMESENRQEFRDIKNDMSHLSKLAHAIAGKMGVIVPQQESSS